MREVKAPVRASVKSQNWFGLSFFKQFEYGEALSVVPDC